MCKYMLLDAYLGGKYIGVGLEVEPAGTTLISVDSWIASLFFFFLLGDPLHAQYIISTRIYKN